MSLRAAIKSPCVNVCVIDEPSGLCTGCGRTLDEIAGWSHLSDKSRAAVMEELGARLRNLQGDMR
ncbi:hypothetical protein C8N35_11046 [Breoghania corrubedonensis]|uniref:Fe-S protein YdhL (DUF1289 family) n=1 Tax=Breoghania corrubedonensis TaxID=665038 RepID=A0A2T5V1D2_9HYPH|nr:DUF1289 domain-containing protein [Breoghania corrubedonensis]PTW57567.1 hypothetical protein C8N35_11046 [Breoghania corrubedonensis]